MLYTIKITKFDRFAYRPHFAPSDKHGWHGVFEFINQSGDLLATTTVSQFDDEDPEHWWVDSQVLGNGMVVTSQGIGSRDCRKHNVNAEVEAVLTQLAQTDQIVHSDDPHIAQVEIASGS